MDILGGEFVEQNEISGGFENIIGESIDGNDENIIGGVIENIIGGAIENIIGGSIENTVLSGAIEGGNAKTPWYKIGGDLPIISKAGGLMPEQVTECSLISPGAGNPGDACSSNATIAKVAEVFGEKVDESNMTPETRKEIIDEAKKKVHCDDEKCVITHSDVLPNLGKDVVQHELETNFKKKGPTDTSLLNNFNIDQTLEQWRVKFPDFFAYNFNMRDYERKGDTLATVNMRDLYNKGIRTAGCVINSDYYSGRGKHWMALFADMRDLSRGGKWTVEFFNSSGNPPYSEFAAWLIKTKGQMEEILSSPELKQLNISVEIINCCDIPHQKTKTECGLYSLYYIWARLNRIPPSFFQQNIISDVLMINFRQHLFTGSSNKGRVKGALGIVNGTFDIRHYDAGVQWEDEVDDGTIKAAKSGKGGGGEINITGSDDYADNDVAAVEPDITLEPEIIDGGYSAEAFAVNSELGIGGAEGCSVESAVPSTQDALTPAQEALTPAQKKLGYTGCQIGEPIEQVTQKLVAEGLLTGKFIYGNLTSAEEISMKKKTNGGLSFPGPDSEIKDFSLILHHGSEHRLPYRRRTNEPKLTLHWGQRKLFLSEIEAIIECADILFGKAETNLTADGTFDAVLLYAGSAPGTHIPYLAKLFPRLKFILYDPREFAIKETPQIEIHVGFFTDEIAKKYSRADKKKNPLPILFVSDIRTGSSESSSEKANKEFEEAVARDMQMQWDWQKIGEFDAAFYKFRLPYCSEESPKFLSEYLDGALYYGIFMPRTSTEARLLVRASDGGKTRMYDPLVYEQEHFYHNTIRRTWGYFDHDIIGEGIDHCYDCRAEIEVLRKYVNWKHHADPSLNTKPLTEADLARKVALLSKDISCEISSHGAKTTLVHPPHGVCKNVSMEEKFGYLISKYSEKIFADAARKIKWKGKQAKLAKKVGIAKGGEE